MEIINLYCLKTFRLTLFVLDIMLVLRTEKKADVLKMNIL